eukprot:364269-Chlamydomonas_euryale.AAC.11
MLARASAPGGDRSGWVGGGAEAAAAGSCSSCGSLSSARRDDAAANVSFARTRLAGGTRGHRGRRGDARWERAQARSLLRWVRPPVLAQMTVP